MRSSTLKPGSPSDVDSRLGRFRQRDLHVQCEAGVAVDVGRRLTIDALRNLLDQPTHPAVRVCRDHVPWPFVNANDLRSVRGCARVTRAERLRCCLMPDTKALLMKPKGAVRRGMSQPRMRCGVTSGQPAPRASRRPSPLRRRRRGSRKLYAAFRLTIPRTCKSSRHPSPSSRAPTPAASPRPPCSCSPSMIRNRSAPASVPFEMSC